MKYFALTLILLFSHSVFGESVFCVGVKSVALFENDNGQYDYAEVDVSNKKYLIKQDEGIYKLKDFGGKDYLMPCQTEYFCTCGRELWCGQFVRTQDGGFTYFLDTSFANGRNGSQIIKGHCEGG